MIITTGHIVLYILIELIGFFFMGLCYYTVFFTKSSGVPFFGGIIVAVGFLISPWKWFALLGLLDYGVWALPYALISPGIDAKRYIKRFTPVFEENKYKERFFDKTRLLYVRIKEREEELQWEYITRHFYRLYIPKLVFSICIDEEGNRFLLTDELGRDGHIEVRDFNEDVIILPPIKTRRGKTMTVELEVREKD